MRSNRQEDQRDARRDRPPSVRREGNRPSETERGEADNAEQAQVEDERGAAGHQEHHRRHGNGHRGHAGQDAAGVAGNAGTASGAVEPAIAHRPIPDGTPRTTARPRATTPKTRPKR